MISAINKREIVTLLYFVRYIFAQKTTQILPITT